MNHRMKQLFFGILDTEPDDRHAIPKVLEELPYLNGGLFRRSRIERENLDLEINATNIRNIIEFLKDYNL